MMKKNGIDIGKTSFLQLSESSELESESESSSESENRKKLSFEEQVEEELGMKTESEEQLGLKKEEEENKSEKDEFVDDDEAVPVKKPEIKKNTNLKKKEPKKENIPYIFAEVSSKSLKKGDTPPAAGSKDKDVVYNPPADKLPPQKLDKIKILRENSMRQLQKSYVWTPSKSERNDEAFSKIKYQQGNKEADLFVSFLGYIRDTSYKQSPSLFDKIKKHFVK